MNLKEEVSELPELPPKIFGQKEFYQQISEFLVYLI